MAAAVGMDDAGLEALLFPPLPDVPSDQRPVPDWSAVHRDLRRPNVTLALLWAGFTPPSTPINRHARYSYKPMEMDTMDLGSERKLGIGIW